MKNFRLLPLLLALVRHDSARSRRGQHTGAHHRPGIEDRPGLPAKVGSQLLDRRNHAGTIDAPHDLLVGQVVHRSIGDGSRKETGLRIDMDGSLTRFVTAPGGGAGSPWASVSKARGTCVDRIARKPVAHSWSSSPRPKSISRSASCGGARMVFMKSKSLLMPRSRSSTRSPSGIAKRTAWNSLSATIATLCPRRRRQPRRPRRETLLRESCGFEPRLRIQLDETHSPTVPGSVAAAATPRPPSSGSTGCSRPSFRATRFPPPWPRTSGSDVPFFIYQSAAPHPAVGANSSNPSRSRTNCRSSSSRPPFGVPTPWAYQHWHDSREIPGVRYTAQEFSWGTLVNDLERLPSSKSISSSPTWKSWLLTRNPGSPVRSCPAPAPRSSRCSTTRAARHRSPRASSRNSALNVWCCLCETVGGQEGKSTRHRARRSSGAGHRIP